MIGVRLERRCGHFCELQFMGSVTLADHLASASLGHLAVGESCAEVFGT
jgi:hypothetical protein